MTPGDFKIEVFTACRKIATWLWSHNCKTKTNAATVTASGIYYWWDFYYNSYTYY